MFWTPSPNLLFPQPARGCRENGSGSAQALQRGCGILDRGIDVYMCTQILRELLLPASASDCDSTESHVAGKLDTKMSETANSLHGDQITAAQAGVAKSVVGRDPRAEKRSGIYGGEFVGNGSDPARLRDHAFRVSSVDRNSRRDCLLTIYDVSP